MNGAMSALVCCSQERELLTHVDNSARGPDTEAEEEYEGDAEEGDDDGAGALAEAARDGLDGSRHGGDGARCGGGGGRDDTAAVVRLHDGPHLTDALYDGVLGCAAVSETLGELGALVSEAGVGAVGVVPQLRIVGIVSPGVAGPAGSHKTLY